MPKPYRHTQPGYVTGVSLSAALVLTLFLIVIAGLIPIVGGVAVLLFIALISSSSLTVEVNQVALRVWFGPGLIRRRIPLNKIRSVRVVHNPWYYGWGIRWIPGTGWLFNVSGTAAVELGLEEGKKFRIGTDDPGGLAQALELRGIPYRQ